MFYSFIIHTVFTRKNAHDESMNITPEENKGIKKKQNKRTIRSVPVMVQT